MCSEVVCNSLVLLLKFPLTLNFSIFICSTITVPQKEHSQDQHCQYYPVDARSPGHLNAQEGFGDTTIRKIIKLTPVDTKNSPYHWLTGPSMTGIILIYLVDRWGT